MPTPIEYSWLIPVLPAVAAGIVALFGARVLKGASHWPIWIGVGGSAILSLWILCTLLGQVDGMATGLKAGLTYQPEFFTWIAAGRFEAKAAFLIDPLTAVMLAVVTGIGFLIMVFSAGYMHGEKGYWRFFASLGLFIFAMTTLVMGNNLLLLFLGWEGVGLASYLLIGYYSDQPAAREAAKKAFIVNRIGDCGMAIGMMLIYLLFGTLTYFTPEHTGFLDQIASGVKFVDGSWEATAFHAIPFLLMLGCFGKSAQWPLFTWLPDAMAGPTPVSALIHAATMVTAGIYLTVRCGPVFYSSPLALTTLGVVACFTSILTATIAMRQYDLKKVFAYSTVSQLGFMFVGVAALAPVAGIFHVVTHAFFKALLFLGSGVVMHATGGELDLRKMSGLKKILPVTNWLMLIGCAALAGFPFVTAGFYSKDEILANAFNHNVVLGALMLACAGLTAYYTFRLYFRVFCGEEIIPGVGPTRYSEGMAPAADAAATAHDDPEEGDDHGHAHPAAHDASHGHDDHHHSHEPLILVGPLVVLAVGALLAGFLNFPAREHNSLSAFLGHSQSLAAGYDVARTRFWREVGSSEAMGTAAEQTSGTTAEGKTTTGATVVDSEPFGIDAAGEAEIHHTVSHGLMMGLSAVVSLAGIGLAYFFHLKNRGAIAATNGSSLARVLEGRYWLDEIYDAAVVKPLFLLGKAADLVDMLVNAAVWAVGYVPQVGALAISYATGRGRLQGYAVTMAIGIVIVLVVVFRH